MGDVCSDTHAQIRIMCDAYEELEKRYPHHELLKMITLTRDEIKFNPSYFERFVKPYDKHNIQSDGRYTEALEKAVRELRPKLTRKSVEKKEISNVVEQVSQQLCSTF